MNRFGRALVLAVLLVPCVGCDQLTKSVARTHLSGRPPIELLGGAVSLGYTENPGGFLSLGADLPRAARISLFTGAAASVLVGLVAMTLCARRMPFPQLAGIALLAAGGTGNLVDRVSHGGAVVDFVNLGLGRVRTGTFNMADVAILAGIALLALPPWSKLRHPPGTAA